ncbi:hypothetical protein LF1_36590 [Rubripirellula obstinata]|uniref:Uncharacterized protein n=1 Tax=Rubripirellula obstinata TaxID=406547 RepID=A0A5B1CMI4_9BACT|nr:hypothetical protein LF1_36590 [Rubripirellula obstinata]
MCEPTNWSTPINEFDHSRPTAPPVGDVRSISGGFRSGRGYESFTLGLVTSSTTPIIDRTLLVKLGSKESQGVFDVGRPIRPLMAARMLLEIMGNALIHQRIVEGAVVLD